MFCELFAQNMIEVLGRGQSAALIIGGAGLAAGSLFWQTNNIVVSLIPAGCGLLWLGLVLFCYSP